jgi:hypothetical protein
MTVEVIIPWRGGCPHREAALVWVLEHWARSGYTITIAEAPEGDWCKAAAVTPAVEASTADLIVIADADVWCDDVPAAVAQLGEYEWAIPHQMVFRLDEPSTVAVLAGGDPADGTFSDRPYRGREGGGIVIVRRDAYLDTPLDPRFIGWGQEDDALGLAMTTLHGVPWRGQAHLFHCWHPPQPRKNRGAGSDKGMTLFRRYKSARHDPTRMRQLIEEAKAHGDPLLHDNDHDPPAILGAAGR